MSSLSHNKPLSTQSHPDKENAPFSSNSHAEKKGLLTQNKYPKLNEILPKPTYGQDPLSLQAASSQHANHNHKLPLKGYKEAEIVKKLNAYRLKKALVPERSSYNERPRSIVMQRDRYSVANNQGRMSVIETGERYSFDESTRHSFIKAQKSQIVESVRSSFAEKEPMKLNPVLEPVVKHEKQEEEIVPEKITSFVKEKKKPVQEKIPTCQEQCDKILQEYAVDIMQSLKMKDIESTPSLCLEKHNIPANIRAKMIDWMIEVLGSYKCLDQTFFISVSLMDQFLQKTKDTQEVSDLHLVGVTCMFMASKYEEIYPLRLSVVHQNIGHRKLSPEVIKQKEMEIFSTLEYKMTNTTPYELIINTIFQLNLKETMTPKLYDYLLKVCTYLAKANMHDYELISQQNYSELAGATLLVALKIIQQLDKSFPLAQMLAKTREILQVEEDVVYDCATRILSIVENFDKVFPNLKNLKKFHSFDFDDISADKTTDEKSARSKTVAH